MPTLSQVDIALREGRHHFRGLETCGSVWTCPVCAVKITEGRRAELQALIEQHLRIGGRAAMLTFTIPHYRFSHLVTLLGAISCTWRKVKQGRAWKDAREKFGWFGDVRALEVTHGGNGWHPHLHILVFFEPWAENGTCQRKWDTRPAGLGSLGR